MNLLVVRHAPAGDRAQWRAEGKDDALRPLTAEGKRRMGEVARGLARLAGPPEALAASPLVRAGQTARILARALGVGVTDELAALAPGSPPQAILPWLRARSGLDLVAVVGHEPHLGQLASWLLAGRSRSFVTLKKGGACLLDLGARPGPGRAELAWLLAPAQLRRLPR